MGTLEEGQIANLVATLDTFAVTPDAFVTGVAQALAAYVAARKDALTAGTLRMGEAPVVVGGVRVTITLDDGANHLDAAIGMNATPWPLPSILDTLARAAEHLIRDHDCDAHGHELAIYAAKAAREWLRVAAPEPPR